MRQAVRAWNLMGGLEWSALEIVAEMLGVIDIDLFIVRLTTLRDTQREAS